MKIRRQIKPRAYKRFINMCCTALAIGTMQYMTDQSILGIIPVGDNDVEFDQFSYLWVQGQDDEDEDVDQDTVEGDEVEEEDMKYMWLDVEYDKQKYLNNTNGYVIEYYNDGEECDSFILPPGITLQDKTGLGVLYLFALGYMFLGIAIVSDIFMEAIESITSQHKTLELWDKDGKKKYYIDTPIWNATVANLTLMALGSSAPEILLSVITTIQDLESVEGPGELGPSTIVGSAAFNLLIISALSIIAVGEEPKKIYDTSVFAVTSIASIFAYVWLYVTLDVISREYVEVWEAWLTLLYFVVLIVVSFAADKATAFMEEKKKTQEEILQANRNDEIKIKKNRLKHIAKDHTDILVIEIAQGIQSKETAKLPEMIHREIKTLYKEILEVSDLSDVPVDVLHKTLQPDSLLERFAYRKQAGMGNNKEFIKLKGQRGQISHEQAKVKVAHENELLGFKCLHYSVTESNGTVDICIVKKVINQDITFGFRTIADTAVDPKDYEHQDKIITIKKRDTEAFVQIPIVDDDEWEPDLDFYIELYDPTSPDKERFPGDDTRCKVTILDEDFPGVIGFEVTDVRVSRQNDKAKITLVRSEGSDGRIGCRVRTESLFEQQTANNAVEFDDYVPKDEKVTFEHGENSKNIYIQLVNEKVPDMVDGGKKGDESGEESEAHDVIFKVKLEKPEPSPGVKISKKNVCLVTIVGGEDEADDDEQKKMFKFFMQQKEITWGQQFKNAVMLGPQIDEEDMILEDVSAYEAACHYLAIGWKVIFALIPPANYAGGKASFFIALVFIGLLTGVVGEVATVLGCVIKLDESVAAITLVALGTSLPDTFASMTAAQSSEYADSAIGNITGSNSVNVFLGLGMPWVVAVTYFAKYKQIEGQDEVLYYVPPGKLAFSVFVFLIVAIICFMILILRRFTIKGELGGPTFSKYLSAATLIMLWCIYIGASTYNAYTTVEVDK